jgi:hypothetical protein
MRPLLRTSQKATAKQQHTNRQTGPPCGFWGRGPAFYKQAKMLYKAATSTHMLSKGKGYGMIASALAKRNKRGAHHRSQSLGARCGLDQGSHPHNLSRPGQPPMRGVHRHWEGKTHLSLVVCGHVDASKSTMFFEPEREMEKLEQGEGRLARQVIFLSRVLHRHPEGRARACMV